MKVSSTVSYVAMSASILRYFKPRDGLPDPNGSLSASLPSQAIDAVNREVERTIDAAKGKKRGPYIRSSHSYSVSIASVCRFSQCTQNSISPTAAVQISL